MAQEQAVQQAPTEITKKNDPATQRLRRKIRHAKVRKRLFQLYVLALIAVTGAFGYHLVDVFVLQHNAVAGTPYFGHRLDDLQPIPDNIKQAASSFGTTLPGVISATVDNRGAVIFVDVRVNEYVELEAAQSAAEQLTDYFLERAGDLADGYNLQIVVSAGDLATLAAENRRAAIDHIYNYFYFLAETTVSHAEEFSVAGNITRAQDNINVFNNRFNNPEGAHRENFRETTVTDVANLQARLDAIIPWTEDEEAQQLEAHGGRFPNVLQGSDRLVPQSNINDFPSWGIINRETGQFQWN